MRAIAKLTFDFEDRVIHAGSSHRAQQAVAEAEEAQRHLPKQQMQNVVAIATSLASLIYSSAQNPPVPTAGTASQIGVGPTTAFEHDPAAEIDHSPMPVTASLQKELADNANAELSDVAASPITQRNNSPAIAAQDTAAAIPSPKAAQDAGAAIDTVLQATGSTPSVTATSSASAPQGSAQDVLAPIGSAQLALTPDVSATSGPAEGTSAPGISAHNALAQGVSAQGVSAQGVSAQDVSALDLSAQDAAAALAGRQQAANKAVDELFAEVTSVPAERAAAGTVLAAAAGPSPVAAALRQQIVYQALQELSEAQHSSSHGPPSGASAATAAQNAAIDLAATITRSAPPLSVSDTTAPAATLTGAAVAAVQRQSATGQGQATQFAEPKEEQEMTLTASDESSDGAAARQYALDKAIDELVFPERSSSDSAASSGSRGGASQSTSSSHAVEEAEVLPIYNGSSSSDVDSQADSAAESDAELDELFNEGASAEDARAQLHDSLTAALQALQHRAGFGSNDDQPRIPLPAARGAGTAHAAVASLDAASGQAQSPASPRAARPRQSQSVLGLPSLRPVARARRTTVGNQPSDTVTVPVTFQEQPADAEVLQAYQELQQRAAQDMQAGNDDDDTDYPDGQNMLQYLPASHQPVNRQVVGEPLQHRDQMPRRLVESEQKKEGDAWKHKVPPFHAVHATYRDGHVAGVREQTRCRRQIGFPRTRMNHKKLLNRVFKGALAVAGAVLTASIVSKTVDWHADHDSSSRKGYAPESDESETESDEDFNYHHNNKAVRSRPKGHGIAQAENADSSSEDDGPGPMPWSEDKLHGIIAKLRGTANKRGPLLFTNPD